jgi:quercetin dioxygenase-like cupin family protein
MVVVGYVIRGRWKYLEHDWVAEEGSFVYEPPGEIHTLTKREAQEKIQKTNTDRCTYFTTVMRSIRQRL